MNLEILVLKMIWTLEAVTMKTRASLTVREKNVSLLLFEDSVFVCMTYLDEQFCRHSGKKDYHPTKLKFPRRESDPEIPANHSSRNPKGRVMMSVIKTGNMG
jgi:hypothetical protein